MADNIEPVAINEFRKIPAAPKEAKSGIDVVEEAITRFGHITSREEESRILGIEDLIFVDQEGGTYNDTHGFMSGDVRKGGDSRDQPPAPKYQIDRISPVIEEATADQREAQINIQVSAAGQMESDVSDTMSGLIRNIERVSDAQDAYDGSYDECQRSGYGGWQVVTEYADDSFEQNIFIEPILNATQSLFFGPAKKADKSDALYAFVIWDMDQEEFKATYPDAIPIDFKSPTIGSGSNRSWFNSRDNLIRVAAYWRKRPVKKEIFQLSNGKIIDDEDLKAALKDPVLGDDGQIIPAVTIALGADGEQIRRKVDTYQVERFILNGVEVLKGPQKWAGKFIPLIPEYGIRSVVNGREIIRGRVRKGKDAQRIYNYGVSQAVTSVSKTGLDITWMTAAQIGGNIEKLNAMSVDQDPIYQYTNDPDVPGPPKKSEAPHVPQAMMAIIAQAREDIAVSVGASIGMQDGTAQDPRSGEAIKAGAIRREKGNSIPFNNHIRSVKYTGVILADLIPRIWTKELQLKIIKPDGEEDFVTVNQTSIDLRTGEKVIVNDLSQGQFDIVVDVGPAYASQRQQGFEMLTELATKNPAFAALTADLIAKNADMPGSDELFKRLRKSLILDGTIDPTDDEREEFGIDEREQLVQELTPGIREEVTNEVNIRLLEAQTNQLNADAGNLNAKGSEVVSKVGKTAAETDKIMADVDKTVQETLNTTIEGMGKMMDNFIKQLEAGIPFDLRDHDVRTKQQDLIEEEQQAVSEGPSSALVEEIEQTNSDIGTDQ